MVMCFSDNHSLSILTCEYHGDNYAMASDSFTILGLWVLGLAVSIINESQLQTYVSKTLFLMTSLQILMHPGTRQDSLK